MVCAGEITLQAARNAIQTDWRAAYRQYVAPSPSGAPRDCCAWRGAPWSARDHLPLTLNVPRDFETGYAATPNA